MEEKLNFEVKEEDLKFKVNGKQTQYLRIMIILIISVGDSFPSYWIRIDNLILIFILIERHHTL